MTDNSVPKHGEKLDEHTEYCGFCDAFKPLGHTATCIGVDPDLIEDDEQLYAAVDTYPARLAELQEREAKHVKTDAQQEREIAIEITRELGGHALRKLEAEGEGDNPYRLVRVIAHYKQSGESPRRIFPVLIWDDPDLDSPTVNFEYMPDGTLHAGWVEFPDGSKLYI